MFDIQDYYLGVILASPGYFDNPKNKQRCYSNVENDPFSNMSAVQALVMGRVVLLRKKEDYYYDEDYSRYPNELSYQLGQTNSLDITLAYVKPFCELFPEDICFFEQQDVFESPEKLEDMIIQSYYIMYDKLKKSHAVVINDTDRLSLVRDEYLDGLMKGKTLAKSHKK